jgi:hypothetical protein
MATARNVAIILILAAGVAFVPGGSTTASVISRVLYELITVIFVAFAVRFYVERRIEIFSLGDRDRGLVYAALGAIVVALAGRLEWVGTGAGTLVFVALLGFAAFALITVFQRWRAYQ